MRTGRLLATFEGAHRGSVLCLKFEFDEAGVREGDGEREVNLKERGFMVTGSSDCSVCVWDLWTSPRGEGGAEGDKDGEREVHGEVRAVLKGHVGGVLDLRIDKEWIVSW